MRIKDLRAAVLRFPVSTPLIERPIDTYEMVFCEVETDQPRRGGGGAHTEPSRSDQGSTDETSTTR